MRNRPIIILLGLLWTINLLGQVQNDVKQILSKKDFVSFKGFADSLLSKEQKISCHWTIFRDLTTDFKERIFFFSKSIPDSKNPGISSIYTFRVRLLITDKTIIYYDLSEKRNRKVKKEWVPYYDTLDYYKNDSFFSILRQSFHNSFKAELNVKELFIDDLVYGHACGIIGEDPKEKLIIDNLVENKNKVELFKWLQSTNFEKQLYAVDGLYQLKESVK